MTASNLAAALRDILVTLNLANEAGVITATIWHGPGETLWDFIQNTIDAAASPAAPAQQAEPRCPHDGQCHPGFCPCSDAKRAQQAPTAIPSGPALHAPSGFVFDEVLAAVEPDDLVPLTPQGPSSTVGERVERLKFELRQAMIDYGAAERAKDDERIRETSTRGVALIDSLAPLAEPAAQAEPVVTMPATDDRRTQCPPYGHDESDQQWARRNWGALPWLIDNHRAIRAALQAARQPQPAAQGVGLPELPEPAYTDQTAFLQAYSADQMHAYARAALAQAPAAEPLTMEQVRRNARAAAFEEAAAATAGGW